MKKILLLSVLILCTLSCSKEKANKASEIKQEKKSFHIVENTSTVSWTAYKTTEKIPVKGVFSEINIVNPKKSEEKKEVLENLTFSMPISSFFSNNEIRDTKIKKLFFGLMDNTTALTGTFNNVDGDDKKGTIDLNLIMNNNNVIIPMTYTITGPKVVIDGTMENMLDWKIDKSYNALHKACELLHKGSDGISKTWKEVNITATTQIGSN